LYKKWVKFIDQFIREILVLLSYQKCFLIYKCMNFKILSLRRFSDNKKIMPKSTTCSYAHMYEAEEPQLRPIPLEKFMVTFIVATKICASEKIFADKYFSSTIFFFFFQIR